MTAIKQIEDALAAGPTDGPWYGHFDSVRTSNLPQHRRDISRCIVDVTCTRGKSEWEKINSLYIAACNPANMREVLAHISAQDAEIARLTKCLAAANSNTEEFERKWYLLGDEIARLREALLDLADDIADRFDLASPSTNPGMKSTVLAARAALATTTPKG